MGSGPWIEQRRRDVEFLDKDPEVVIVGGAHSGLETAARLKALGVSTLVVEKTPRVGDVVSPSSIWFETYSYTRFTTVEVAIWIFKAARHCL